MDGRLDEPAWERARPAPEFVQGEPVEGARPVHPTTVRVLFDDQALYVGARMQEDDASAIADQLVRRDASGQYDYFEILLDPERDGRTGYLFRVSASGVQRDAYLFDDSEEDENWDAVWSSAVRRDSAGWSAEVRIPLSQLRYESGDGAPRLWGVNFVRRRLASNSISYLALQSRTIGGRVSQFGRLAGLELIGSPHPIEVEPYLATRLVTGPSAAGDPFFDGSELEPRAGLDATYRIGSSFSLNATLNPDFGQVEVDPAVVNLTAFETFFPEKRPFFVQDARIFDFELSGRQSRLFFSRRIGREPQGRVPDEATFVDAPERTTILGAAKLTGRTPGGLSLGLLGALTPEETAAFRVLGEPDDRRVVLEPASQYGVLRLQQELREGATRVGGILTAMRRDLPPGGELDALPSSALAAALDLGHEWGGPSGRRWSLSGYLAATHVRGDPAAMVAIQTNPQHYFQRPDAENLSVDSTATHLTGVNWNVEFARRSGEHWTYSVSLEELAPDFSVNDLGFYDQGEQFDLTANATYREIDPGPLFRSWEVSSFTYHELRHELFDGPFSSSQWARAYKDGEVNVNAEFELHNNWDVDLGVEFGPRSLSDTDTRGGPLMTDPASFGWEVGFRTDSRRAISLGPTLEVTRRSQGAGEELELELDLTVRPAPAFQLGLEPSLSFEEDGAQFVMATDAVPYEATYGRRYLFADLERTELSLAARLDVAFSPELSFQLFAQPLIAAADFVTYKQLARPESYAFTTFEEGSASTSEGEVRCVGGTTCVADGVRWFDLDADGIADESLGGRDFNFRSLRGNAVLRWEYRPGSTLFLVWQQSRESEEGVGSFELGRDLDGLFGAPAENTFILKVSHYLSL